MCEGVSLGSPIGRYLRKRPDYGASGFSGRLEGVPGEGFVNPREPTGP